MRIASPTKDPYGDYRVAKAPSSTASLSRATSTTASPASTPKTDHHHPSPPTTPYGKGSATSPSAANSEASASGGRPSPLLRRRGRYRSPVREGSPCQTLYLSGSGSPFNSGLYLSYTLFCRYGVSSQKSLRIFLSQTVSMEKIVAFCKRRGFVFQSSEIYGGIRSSYDYGPLGVEMKRNIKEEWWRRMVHMRDDVVGIEAAIIMHPRVWEALGHVAGFNDMLVESRSSGRRYRADHLIENATGQDVEGLPPEQLTEIIQSDERIKDPVDGGRDFAPVRPFNLMFETYTGPVKSPENVAYLRPETAQGIFVNFKNVLQTSRVKVPFGIAQIGKSFRNEITPGNFIFRTREFEQMEMEFFVKPGTDEEWHEYWIEERFNWYLNLGLREENLRKREQTDEERAHYATRGVDIEYNFPFAGWSELEGIANRTDYDLKKHQEYSGENLTYFDQATGEATSHTSSSRQSDPTALCWPSWWTPTPRRRSAARSAPSSSSTRASPR